MVVKRDKWVLASLTLITLVAFVTSGGAAILAWWTWGPVPNDYSVLHPELHRATYEDGVITVRRIVMTRRPMTVEVSREIVKLNSGDRSVLSGPATIVAMQAHPDGYDFTRDIVLGYRLEPGSYVLRSFVTWPANPVRNVTTPVQELRFEVRE